MIIVILLVIALFGGGGSLSGLFGNLFGGGGQIPVNYGIPETIYENISPQENTGWIEPSNESSLDTDVAAGTRAKRTKILGNGRDTNTIMVYMCASDLESRSGMATNDLVEMTKATLSNNVRVLVYAGGTTKWNNRQLNSNYNQVFEIKNGGIQMLESKLKSVPMTDPNTLTDFIKYCVREAPANRYHLILWDHGGGSVSGYGHDERFQRNGSMPLSGLNTALKNAGVAFDIIGFDTCLLATVENGLMLDNYGDYMVASEETEPGIGWYYTNWLTKLSSNPSMSSVEIGKNIVDDFTRACQQSCQGQNTTLSVVDLAELANTVPTALKNFSESLTKKISEKDYSAISSARSSTREFAQSTKIDQIDLVHFAKNLNTAEGDRLANALLSAIKYNRTSSNMTNAYGLSIYFPYRKPSNVDKAVSNYKAIGLDDSYSRCIQAFASVEVSGQAVTGGDMTSALPSLLGQFTGGGNSGMPDIGSLLGTFLGGGRANMKNLGDAEFLNNRVVSDEEMVEYLTENYFDESKLVWSQNAQGQTVMVLPEDQWSLVTALDLNMFYDDGEGYIDLGLDNIFDFDDDGNLLLGTDRTWVAVNGQPVAYYHEDTQGSGKDLVITGRIPALVDGVRMDLIVVFTGSNPYGQITGARYVYDDEDLVDISPKALVEIEDGAKIDFLCDYYTYDGEYQDTYFIGNQLTYSSNMMISNVDVGNDPVVLTYRFTDIYQQHHWTPSVTQSK